MCWKKWGKFVFIKKNTKEAEEFTKEFESLMREIEMDKNKEIMVVKNDYGLKISRLEGPFSDNITSKLQEFDKKYGKDIKDTE